ncbi:MAG: aminodeoxychorismate/anthranilate synthase component II [Nocardioidaceae bacterium]
MIDNYDSFVYNLSQYIGELAACPTVLRNDGDSVEEVVRLARTGAWDGIVISPGPGVPGDAGMSSELVARLAGTVPILGVCLGHQCIAETFGARVGRVETILHGKSSLVQHDGQGVFAAMAGPLTVGRYHSLVVESASLPQQLIVTARTVDGVIMGVRHRDLAVEGVQFHPESILTPRGHELMANFLRMCT